MIPSPAADIQIGAGYALSGALRGVPAAVQPMKAGIGSGSGGSCNGKETAVKDSPPEEGFESAVARSRYARLRHIYGLSRSRIIWGAPEVILRPFPGRSVLRRCHYLPFPGLTN
jgi:hypothetical protein